MKDRYWRITRQVIDDADIVLHIADARWGTMTVNSKLLDICKDKNKPVIVVFNKCDLIDKSYAEKLKKQVKPSVFVSSTQYLGTKLLREAIGKHSPKVKDRDIMIGVVGYPNVGKSSIINALRGKGSAKASSRSGTTKGIQHIRLSTKMKLIDAPGVLPTDEMNVNQRILLDSKNIDHIKDPIGVVSALLEFLEEKYGQEWINNTFEINSYDDYDDLLEQIAIQKNRKISGGKPDILTIARVILKQWQKGELTYA